jgi:hypothetical protein
MDLRMAASKTPATDRTGKKRAKPLIMATDGKITTKSEGSLAAWSRGLLTGLSADGLAGLSMRQTREALVEARSKLFAGADDALNEELPVGKSVSVPGYQAIVVRLSKRLANMAKACFENFASSLAKNVPPMIANAGPAMTKRWLGSVIQTSTGGLWRDMDTVFANWLDQIRARTDGAAYGARARSIDDPEYLTIQSHQERMRIALWRIAERHSIPSETVAEALEDRGVPRQDIGRSLTPDPSRESQDMHQPGAAALGRPSAESPPGGDGSFGDSAEHGTGIGIPPPAPEPAAVSAGPAHPESTTGTRPEQPGFDGGTSGTQSPAARAAKQLRAATVAKLIKELNDLKPQMFEDEAEYNELRARYPDFLTFKIAEGRPDLKMKVLAMRGSTRHIRLAQELAAAHHGRELSTIRDDWKDHKPPEFRRQG